MKIKKTFVIEHEKGDIELSNDDYQSLKDDLLQDEPKPVISEAMHPFKIGMKIFARLVTYHITGEIIEINDNWLTLDHAAWIADSGRFADALKSGEFSEVEPYSEKVYINIETATDVTTISTLPMEQV